MANDTMHTTPTEQEINAIMDKILKGLQDMGIELRQ